MSRKISDDAFSRVATKRHINFVSYRKDSILRNMRWRHR